MRRVLLAAGFCLVGTAARAQDSETILPDQVITATRVPTLLESIPAGVSVIDRAMIEQRGYVTLSDALSEVPGLRVAQSGGPGSNASVFIRGTNSNQVLVLRNGLPINDPSEPGGGFNFGEDMLGDVDRIEVIRGPMSALYGSSAIGGVINIITTQGTGKPTASVQYQAGLPRAQQLTANLTGKSDIWDYSLAAQSGADLGFDTTPRRTSVYTGSRNSNRSSLGTLELGMTPVDGTRFSVFLRARNNHFNLDELGAPAFDATSYLGQDEAVYGRAGVSSKLFAGVVETSLYFGRLQTQRSYNEALEAADPNQAQGYSSYKGGRNDVQWNNTVHLPDWGPASATNATFGYHYMMDTSNSFLNTAFGGYPYYSNTNAAATYNAATAGLQSVLWQRLTLTGGVGEDGGKYGGNAFTWRMGGVLAVPEALSRLKTSYGTAFRAPSLFDLFGVDSYGYAGNPNLRAERSTGWEAGWAVDLPAFARKDAATLEVTYFNNRVRDLINLEYNADYTQSSPQNVAQAKMHGVESSVTVRPFTTLSATAAYTWTYAWNVTDNQPLLRRPTNAVSASVNWRPLPGLSIVPQLVYTGSFHDYIEDNQGFQTGVGPAKPGTILNLAINYQVMPQVKLFVIGTNLGGSRFEPASGFQTPGTQLLAGTRVQF